MFLFPQPSAVGREVVVLLRNCFCFLWTQAAEAPVSSPLWGMWYVLCGSWPHEDFGMQLMGSAVLGPVWCVHRCCLCITGTNMILHLARVFYQATFLHKIKLDSSVKNGKFSEFKACRRFFFLPVFSVLSFLEELSKHLIYGCDEGVFQVNVRVSGAWRNQAGSSSEPLLSIHLVVLLPRSV